MQYGVIGPDRQLRHHIEVDLPGPSLPHDMAITEWACPGPVQARWRFR
jgi:carotenoid cleavage dioxygenase